MNYYKVLSEQKFQKNNFSLIPIREEDRYDIMKWRNEQIYHLRQERLLSKKDQDAYFKNVISGLFEQEQPNQILFSFLKDDICIGYGGLVHINWNDRNAEVSFIMDTSLEENYFYELWKIYLELLRKVAFEDLLLHKIYVYAYDLRAHLYEALENSNFILDARLVEHCYYNGEYKDVVIYSLLNK